jgi:adenylosuccinate lyase
MEWLFLPLIFYTSDAALEAAQAALESLEVDVARMRRGAGTDRVPDAADALIDRALTAADAQWGERR